MSGSVGARPARSAPGFLLAKIALLAFLNALLWVSFVPPWQGVDEPKHFELIRLMRERGGVIAFTTEEAVDQPELQRWIVGSMDAHRFWWYGHAPGYDPDRPATGFAEIWFMGSGSALARTSPVYHWLVARLQPNDRMLGLYFARLLSALLGMVTVLLVGVTAREVFPDDPLVRYGAPLFLALSPMFAFLHAGVNNDVLVNTLAALAFLLMARLIVRGGGVARIALLAGTVALAVVTKRTSVVLVPAAVLAGVLWRAARRRRPLVTMAWWTAVTVAAATVVGVWLVRGGWETLPEVWRWRLVQYFFNDPEQPARILAFLRAPGIGTIMGEYVWGMTASFWGSFGWQLVNFPRLAYAALAVVAVVAAVGVGLGVFDRGPGADRWSGDGWEGAEVGLFEHEDSEEGADLLPSEDEPGSARWPGGQAVNAGRPAMSGPPTRVRSAVLLTFAASVILAAAGAIAFFLAYLNLSYPVPPQGRYLYVTAGPIAILLTVGLGSWLPAPWRGRALVAFAVAMVLFDAVALFGFVVPWFYR